MLLDGSRLVIPRVPVAFHLKIDFLLHSVINKWKFVHFTKLDFLKFGLSLTTFTTSRRSCCEFESHLFLLKQHKARRNIRKRNKTNFFIIAIILFKAIFGDDQQLRDLANASGFVHYNQTNTHHLSVSIRKSIESGTLWEQSGVEIADSDDFRFIQVIVVRY